MDREKISTTPIRLNELIRLRGLKQIDILNKAAYYCDKYNIKLTKSDLSQYISGKVSTPTQDKLFVLANALNVSEAWLMGFDVPMERKTPVPYPQIDQNTKTMLDSIIDQLCDDSHSDEPTPTEKNHRRLLEALNNLNEEGQRKVIDYAYDIMYSGKYKPDPDD